MPRLTIKRRSPNAQRTRALLEQVKRKTADASADISIELASQRVRQGKRPDGSAHKELAKSTIRAKGHGRVLHDTGLLGRASEWQKQPDSTLVRVLPPEGREQIIVYLDQGGRPVFAKTDPELKQAVQRIFEHEQRQLNLDSAIDTEVVR